MLALLTGLYSCDETTDTIGAGLAGNMDNFIIKSDTFLVSSQTKQLGAVQARSAKANLGCIRDYDTGALIRGSYMTQFYLLEGNMFPEKDSIRSTVTPFEQLADSTNIPIEEICADSTYLYFAPENIIGDSLQPMHLKVYELQKPMPDGKAYFSNFDPVKEGYVDISNPLKSMTFTMADQCIDSITKATSGYTAICKIPLNNAYMRNGKTYKNYGTYLMQRYYESKRDGDGAFDNYTKFLYNVCHGLYITVDNGEGCMASIAGTGLSIYFKYWANDTTTRSRGTTTIFGTDEVLQTTYLETNEAALKRLADDNSCSYIKTPAGLYTELTLPVNEIMYGHENDSISNVKLTLQSMKSEGYDGKSYSAPSYLLMIPADSVQTFFDNKKLTDGRTAFLASYNSTHGTYSFENFAGMVTYMNRIKQNGLAGENWNKVAIVPVSVVRSSSSSSSVSAIYHDLSLSSAKLVGGANPLMQTKVSVVYTRMSD